MLLYLCLFSICCAVGAENLRYVQAIWRHGDRAPGGLPYPKDIYDEDSWPRGWNQLTNIGMVQMMELGQYFHQTYSKGDKPFISRDFNTTEAYILSTDADRALTSAQSFLSGLYPPEGNDVWNSEIAWQPIPVHAYGPDEPNPLLKPTSFNCPTYTKLAQEINGPSYSGMLENKTDLVDFVMNHTGIGHSHDLLKEILRLNEVNREIIHNLTQPQWVSKVWPKYGGNTTLQIITELKRRHRWSEFQDPRLAVLRGGFLLGDFLNRAKAVVEGTKKESTDMLLYSSHDGTLSSLLSVMNVSDWQPVPYAACIILEIVEDGGQFYAKLFYRKNKELIPLKVSGCDANRCLFSTFYESLSPRAIFDRETLDKKCGIIDLDPNSAVRMSGVMAVILAVILYLFS